MSQPPDNLQSWLTLRWSLLAHKTRIGRIAWAPDGTSIATVSQDRIALWDNYGTPKIEFSPPGQGAIWDFAWSPDSQKFLYGRGKTIFLGDVARSEMTSVVKPGGRAYAVAWSPNGQLFAYGSTDHSIGIWDARMLASVNVIRTHTKPIYSIAWSPDGRYLASASKDGNIAICDPAMGRIVSTLTGHQSGVTGVAWSPDGALLVSASAPSLCSKHSVDTDAVSPSSLIAQSAAKSEVTYPPSFHRHVRCVLAKPIA